MKRDQTLAEKSSEQEARREPEGSHLMALTSSVCPWNVHKGLFLESSQTYIILSVLQVANDVLFLQSTSSVCAVREKEKEKEREGKKRNEMWTKYITYRNGTQIVAILAHFLRPKSI